MHRTPSESNAIKSPGARLGVAPALCIVAALLTLAVPVHAQLCPGSHLYYVVRDAKGNAVDGTAKTFTAAGAGGVGRWSVAGRDYFGFEPLVPAALLDALKNKVAPLWVSDYCNFKSAVTLRIAMSGEAQELTFHVPQLGVSESRSFLVDGPRFQVGQFEITMTVTAPGQYLFYPASGWRKK
jgi:hypothetical protein